MKTLRKRLPRSKNQIDSDTELSQPATLEMPLPPAGSIFEDRRKESASGVHDCRRSSDFGINALDQRPWWLKVDYVEHGERRRAVAQEL